VALLLAAAGLFARLLAGPIWSTLLADGAAARIAALVGPEATVDLGTVGFALDGALEPEIHVRDMVVTEPGRWRLSVDTASLATRWAGDRRVERLVADHVLLDLQASEGPAPPVAQVVRAIEEALAAPPIRYLEIGALTLVQRPP
jgi:hypothetical protein